MKVSALVLLCLVAAAPAYSVPAENKQKVTYSESAKVKIRDAVKNMIKNLCAEEGVEPEIMNTLCMQAFYSSMGRSVQSYSPKAGNCMDCEVADPVCWDACPQ